MSDVQHPRTNLSSVFCVACGAVTLVADVRARGFMLYRCRVCHTLTSWPRPSPKVLAEYHDSANYFDHPYFTFRRADRRQAEKRARAVFAKLRAVRPALDVTGARHLDIGCDTGTFLESFSRRYATRPVGIDVSARAVAAARARGLEAYQTDLEHAGDLGCFDLITMVDVLEHVAHPIELLRQVRMRLRSPGLCYLETPNVRSTVYRLGRALANAAGGRPAWVCDRLFLPEHVQYFSAGGIEAVAAAAGLRVAACGRRVLASAEVNAGTLASAGVQVLQIADRFLARQILHWAVLVHDSHE